MTSIPPSTAKDVGSLIPVDGPPERASDGDVFEQVVVRLDCATEAEFLERCAAEIALHGLRVELAELPAVGSRIAVDVTLASGRIVGSGHALVTARIDDSAVRVRLTDLDQGKAWSQLSSAAPDGDAPRAETPAPSPPVPTSPAPAPVRRPRVPTPPPHVIDPQLIALLEEGARTPRTALPLAEDAAGGSLRSRRRPIPLVGGVATLIVLLGVGAWVVPHWRGGDRVEAVLKEADARVAQARLTGEDGALEQLLVLQKLAPGEPRTERRLALIGAKLDELGRLALARGDLQEAEVHAAAAARARRGDAAASLRLQEIRSRRAGELGPGAAP